jgi:hypothetical protein
MHSGRNIQYELSDRTRGLDTGGIGVMHRIALQTGLAEEIDRRVSVLKVHLPYPEFDHVLNTPTTRCVVGRVSRTSSGVARMRCTWMHWVRSGSRTRRRLVISVVDSLHRRSTP